ncbi:MAG: hypothetical protein IKK03_07870 [Lachnospiraceae bacterium]|nr:hypothetical protein [Lachnospiraceae bacterium]
MNKKNLDAVYSKYGISIVATKAYTENLYSRKNNQDIYHTVLDARTATFYAMGVSRVSEKDSIVLMCANELCSSYTALTEIVFQNLPVYVFAAKDKEEKFDIEAIRNCGCKIQQATEDNIISVFEYVFKEKRPTVVIYECSNESLPIDVFTKKYIDVDSQEIRYYGSKIHEFKTVNYLGNHYEYGALSKYLGYLAGGKSSILILSYEQFVLDISVLINYHSISNISPRIIVYNTPADKTFQWIEEQGFSIADSNGAHFSDDALLFENGLPQIIIKRKEVDK